jgi:hypothetical protein
VQNPDAYRVYEYQGTRHYLRHAESRRLGRFALAHERDGAFRVTGAWRIREEDADLRTEFTSDPARAFEALLDKYGLDYLADGNLVRFVPVTTIALPSNAISPDVLFEALGLGEQDNFGVHVTLELVEPGTARLTWPFVLATNRYESAER